MQARRLHILPGQAQAARCAASTPAEQSGCDHLGPEQASLIQRADTFFIATYHEAEPDDPVSIKAGNDISHRGGPPGFVQLNGQNRLTWPDYIGNNFFQTLGDSQCSSCLTCASPYRGSLLSLSDQCADTGICLRNVALCYRLTSKKALLLILAS